MGIGGTRSPGGGVCDKHDDDDVDNVNDDEDDNDDVDYDTKLELFSFPQLPVATVLS